MLCCPFPSTKLRGTRKAIAGFMAVEKRTGLGYNGCMRRFTWTLALLTVTSLAVFGVGWLSLRVKPGCYAVVATKTGGVRASVLEAGVFSWSAEALLPTNVRLVQFSPLRAEREFSFSGELPSSAAYRAFMAGEPDFSWKLALRLRAMPRPDSLPELFSRYGVDTPELLSSWLGDEIEAAAADARAIALGRITGVDSSRRLASGLEDEDMRRELALKRPFLEIQELSVSSAVVPDMALYEQARLLYTGYMERYRQSVEPVLARASEAAAADRIRMDTLRRYGELLRGYPEIIDYLAIEAGLPPREFPAVQAGERQ